MTGKLGAELFRALGRVPPAIRSTEGSELEPAALRERASQAAARLRERGLAPDEPVLVTIRNRPADLASCLAVWLAGGVAVPIHAAAAAGTLASLREVSGARFSLDEGAPSVVAACPPPARPLLRGAALVIFTSGSTGKPKGVVIGHERFGGKLDVLDALLGFTPEDTVVVPLQLTFIFGLWVSLLSIRAGARLLLVPRFSPEAVGRTLVAGGTILAVVPSMLRTMLAGPPGAAPALRSILTGGEALGIALAERIAKAFPAAGIHDLYGLTETGSCDFCLQPSAQPEGLGSLGVPTEGVAFRIAGENGTALPAGRSGELLIRTPFAMLGYLDDPDLTRRAFADGFLRTGDLARQRPDGRVELVGRAKEIISRGANKIAPLEIDDLLTTHPAVAAALCAGVPDARLGEAIHAAVVVKAGADLEAEALREWAAARTERFKVPDAIHFCDALPLGSSGKASRAAVAAMALARGRGALS